MKELDYKRALENSIKAGADSAEIYHSNENIHPLMIKNGKIASINSKNVDFFGLRVIKDRKAGFTSTTCFDDIDTYFRKAVDSSVYSSRISWDLPAETNAFSDSHIFDESLVNTNNDDIICLGSSISSRLQKSCPDVIWDINLENRVIRKRIVNSHGVDADYMRTVFAVIVSGTLVGDNEIISVMDYASSSNFETINFPDIINGLSERIEFSKKEYRVKGNEREILFTPNGLASLIKVLEQLIKPYMLNRKDSPIFDQYHKMIAAPDIYVYDDGLLEWGTVTSPVDDEGVPVRVTPIIEAGIFKGGLGSNSEPEPFTGQSTGNCYRNRDCRTQVKASTLVMKEGELSFEEMIQKIDSGLIVDAVVGASPTCQGEFSLTVQTGYGIKNGGIAGRIKDVSISGNILDVLKSIKYRGRGTKLCFDRYLLPSAIVSGGIDINF
jgi:PmbA protein